MIFKTKSISKTGFLLLMLLYVCVSVPIFLLTSGGYSAIYQLVIMGIFYSLAYLAVFVTCFGLKQVLFSPFLAYCVLATQTIAVLLNIGDEGYSGFTCKTKNFIQYFFDRSDACGKLWVGTKDYPWILMLCGVMVIIFICNLMWLRAGQNADRHKDVI